MNIVVISNNYPSNEFPNHGAFVYNLFQLVAKDNTVTVISPFKTNYIFKKKGQGYGNEVCTVRRPLYLSLGNRKLKGVNFGAITHMSYRKAIDRELKSLKQKPDVIYAHFLYNAIPALSYCKKNNVPLVVASGESTYVSLQRRSDRVQSQLKQVVNHLICVSKENKEQLLALGFQRDKMSLIPNAVDYTVFKPLNKSECRKKLGVSKDKFVIGFIGHFVHRKGPNRIIEAIRLLEDDNIELVCVGDGREELNVNSFTRTMDPVPNYQLPEVYNTFDLFVLPTLHEGHCNVIEEAKAIGIPIVSSRGTSVEEQLDESIGVLVDPLNISEIAQAIFELKNDKKRYESMVKCLIGRRGENSLANRAQRIITILSEVVRTYDK